MAEVAMGVSVPPITVERTQDEMISIAFPSELMTKAATRVHILELDAHHAEALGHAIVTEAHVSMDSDISAISSESGGSGSSV